MSAPIETPRSPVPVRGACPLCGVTVAPEAMRCGSCGFHLAGVDGRPGPFSRATLWWSGLALLVVYVGTLVVVLAAR